MFRISLPALMLFCIPTLAADVPTAKVEGQPLAGNIERLLKTLDFLGTPLPADLDKNLKAAIDKKDVKELQALLDPKALLVVHVNPESRVKIARGPAETKLQQAGYVPVLVKVLNESTVKKTLKIGSPQSGPRYSGKGERNPKDDPKIAERFLQVELYSAPPMSSDLSGLEVEYAIVLIYSTESGKREITFTADLGQGNQDLGFRAEVSSLFEIQPAIPVKVSVTDFDGKPTVGRFVFKDSAGHVFPPQPKRLAPDLFFHQQIYRPDGGTVLLPPGEFTVEYGRGPEYKTVAMKYKVTENSKLAVKLERWINPMDYGFYNGDHHIHAAGCAHYTNPTEGVKPEDMFLHVKGEGMNVGCCLTWGPCYDFQRKFFDPKPWERSEPFTLLKYDVEVSGFGSQALGHVCLLNLTDQTYPGSEGLKTKGWPTWTTPLMRWAKAQGGVTGYAHSGNGLGINIDKTSQRLFTFLDKGNKGHVTMDDVKAAQLPLPEPFATIDRNDDKQLSLQEIRASIERTSTKLPNYAIPEMNGIGAQEICVTTAMGVCDFISAMDTDRTPEWNCWYHIMNCGFLLKVSGETDFPCISGSRVGMGRVYVQLGKVPEISYKDWCNGIAAGRSYVSDGYAHALKFTVNGMSSGDTVKLDKPGTATVKATVAFNGDVALGTAPGARTPVGKTRLLELIVNGQVAATKEIPADDKVHEVEFDAKIDQSSWVAIRTFPQMHTNPVTVIVDGKPIRASKRSALWCIGVIEQLWRVRESNIAVGEREEAKKTFDKALEMYRKIAAEAKGD